MEHPVDRIRRIQRRAPLVRLDRLRFVAAAFKDTKEETLEVFREVREQIAAKLGSRLP